MNAAKPTELLRVGLREPMPIARLKQLLEVAGAGDNDTIRHHNGNLIIERPLEPLI
jgi:hypothetical protein